MFCRNFPFAPAGIQAPRRAGPVAMSQNTLALSQGLVSVQFHSLCILFNMKAQIPE